MRTFANPSGITCAVGNASVLSGAFTMAAIIRRTADNDSHVLISLMANTSHRGGLWVASGGQLQVVSSGLDTTFGITVPTDVPVFVLVTKEAGDGVTPHGWMYRYDTDTWTDADAVGTVNADNTALTSVTLGEFGNDWYFVGDYGLGAVWSGVLPPAAIAALPFSLHAWYGSGAAAGWLFDQSDVAQALVDWTGGGANQTARTNTSVSTFSLPVFSYGQPVLVPHSVPAAGGSVVDLTPAQLTLTAVAVNPVPGPVTVNLTPATFSLAGVAVSPVPGPVTVALTPAVVALAGVPVNAVPGGGTVALTPAVLALAAVPVNPVPGPVTVALTPAVLALAAVAVTAQPGPVSVALTPAALALAAVAVDPQQGTPVDAGSMQHAARTAAAATHAQPGAAAAVHAHRAAATMTGR